MVRVDGKRVKAEKALGACLSVPLTEGEHTVELRYVPKGLILGAILTALTALIAGFVCWWNWRKKGRKTA